MGANYREITVRHALRDEKRRVKEAFKAAQEQDAWSMGNRYSGGFNMADGLEIHQLIFESEELASEWIMEKADKWGPAHAVYVPNHGWVIGAWCAS